MGEIDVVCLNSNAMPAAAAKVWPGLMAIHFSAHDTTNGVSQKSRQGERGDRQTESAYIGVEDVSCFNRLRLPEAFELPASAFPTALNDLGSRAILH